MARYLNGVESCLAKLSDQRVKCIPREENEEVEALVGVAAILSINKSIMLPVYVQPMSSITSEQVHDVVHTGVGWMPPLPITSAL